MPGVKISALPAAASVLETDLFATVAAVGPTTQKATMTQVATALGIDISPTNSAAFTVSLYSLTANNAQSMLNLAGTWNTTGTPTAIKLNILDTASDAASLLMDLQVGSNSKCRIVKTGQVVITGAPSGVSAAYTFPNGAVGNEGMWSGGANQLDFTANGTCVVAMTAGQLGLSSLAALGWANVVNVNAATLDVTLFRDAANILALYNGANAQSYRVYGTFTDAANYERLTLTTQAAATILIDSEAAGTGTRRGLTILSASGTLGFFGVTPVVRQTQGATLTNNVTAGGAANTLANYTDLTLYANDAAAIRNNIYQLGQTLKTIVDGLRLFGLFT